MSSKRRTLLVLGVIGAVLLVDQSTKSLIESSLHGRTIHVLGPVYLREVLNSGAAFSIGTGLGPAFDVVAIVVAVGLWYYLRNSSSLGVTIGGAMIIGGALSNVSDRIFRSNHGSVIDFIYTSFWPTFNVADSCITVGVIVLGVSIVRAGKAGHSQS